MICFRLMKQIKKLAGFGTECDVILGGRSKEFVILKDEFEKDYFLNVAAGGA